MKTNEIMLRFPTELDAIRYFEKYRWGKSVKCAYCGSQNLSNRNKDYRFNCIDCKRTFSVTTGTQIHNTRLQLQKWLLGFSMVSETGDGLSALQLQQRLDISYPAAWKMYQKARKLMTMENDGAAPDEAETAQTYTSTGAFQLNTINGFLIAGGPKNDTDVMLKQGKLNPGHAITEGDEYVITRIMDELGYTELNRMVEKYTGEDDAAQVNDNRTVGRLKSIINQLKNDHFKAWETKLTDARLIESFWNIIEKGIISQYHQVSSKHLPGYIAEFVFKYNNRKRNDRFVRLVKNSVLPRTVNSDMQPIS